MSQIVLVQLIATLTKVTIVYICRLENAIKINEFECDIMFEVIMGTLWRGF